MAIVVLDQPTEDVGIPPEFGGGGAADPRGEVRRYNPRLGYGVSLGLPGRHRPQPLFRARFFSTGFRPSPAPQDQFPHTLLLTGAAAQEVDKLYIRSTNLSAISRFPSVRKPAEPA